MKQAELLERLVELNNAIAEAGVEGFHNVEYMTGKKGKIVVSIEGEGSMKETTRESLTAYLLKVPTTEDEETEKPDAD